MLCGFKRRMLVFIAHDDVRSGASRFHRRPGRVSLLRKLGRRPSCNLPGLFAGNADHSEQVDNGFVDLHRIDILITYRNAKPDNGVRRLAPGQSGSSTLYRPALHACLISRIAYGPHDAVHRTGNHFRAHQQPAPSLVGRGGLHHVANAEGINLGGVYEGIRISLDAFGEPMTSLVPLHRRRARLSSQKS